MEEADVFASQRRRSSIELRIQLRPELRDVPVGRRRDLAEQLAHDADLLGRQLEVNAPLRLHRPPPGAPGAPAGSGTRGKPHGSAHPNIKQVSGPAAAPIGVSWEPRLS